MRRPPGRSTRLASATVRSGKGRCSSSSPHDHDVEALIRHRQRLARVRPEGLDPELRSLPQGLAVDVDADDLVAREVVPRQRAVAAPEVEDAGPGPDPFAEELGPLGARRRRNPASCSSRGARGRQLRSAPACSLRPCCPKAPPVHSVVPWQQRKPRRRMPLPLPARGSTTALRSPATSGAAARSSSPPARSETSRSGWRASSRSSLIDLVSVGFGLYGGLVLRELYYGNTTIYWGILWTGRFEDWFPFVALITVLVFWQAGLYAERERRAGFGRVVSSFVVVALLVLAFGLGTGHQFNTFGLIPTALLIAIVLDGLLRASYDAISREALHILGVRRRAIVVGEGEHLHHLLLTLGSRPGGHRVRVRRSGQRRGRDAARASEARPRRRPSGRARRASRGRADRHRLGLLRPAAVPDRRPGAPRRREGQDRAEDDRAADPARRVRSRAGRAAVRAQAARLRRRRVGGQALVRPAGQRRS